MSPSSWRKLARLLQIPVHLQSLNPECCCPKRQQALQILETCLETGNTALKRRNDLQAISAMLTVLSARKVVRKVEEAQAYLTR